ncbi:MAG: hypothetical protein ACI835_004418 [Planctomycetota bacterium]|jgi:hypothetical protein
MGLAILPCLIACSALTSSLYAQFSRQQGLLFPTQGVRGIAAGDLHNDGDNDLVAALQTQNQVAWFENGGNANFGPMQVLDTQSSLVTFVAIADMDADGWLDIFSAQTGNGVVAWFKNLGGGQFAAKQALPRNSTSPCTLVAADLHGDSNLDVLIISYGWDRVLWNENLGNGAFGPQQTIAIGIQGSLGYAEDMDGDGDRDVLTSSSWDAPIFWYEKRANGTFNPRHTIPSLGLPVAFVPADFDRDGDVDLAAANFYGGSVYWTENLGGGNFAQPDEFAGGVPSVRQMLPGAGDGDPDSLFSTFPPSGLSRMYWCENQGDGNFSDKHQLATGGVYDSLVLADLDSDGRKDMVASSRDASRIYWLKGDPNVGNAFCDATINSTGGRALIHGFGSASFSASNLTLVVDSTPEQFGIFYYGAVHVQMPFGNGFRCVGGSTARLGVTHGSGGYLTWDLDITTPPQASFQIQPSSDWNFQAWYRDPLTGVGYNLSDGVEIQLEL